MQMKHVVVNCLMQQSSDGTGRYPQIRNVSLAMPCTNDEGCEVFVERQYALCNCTPTDVAITGVLTVTNEYGFTLNTSIHSGLFTYMLTCMC